MHFTRENRVKDNLVTFTWVTEEVGEKWEFEMLTPLTSASTIEMFQMTLAQCTFESEMKRSQTSATDAEIQKYFHTIDMTDKDTLVKDNIKQKDKDTVKGHSHSEVVVSMDKVGFYMFDSKTGLFTPKGLNSSAKIERIESVNSSAKDKWKYNLVITITESNSDNQQILLHEQAIDPDATQHLDRNSNSFIWCNFTAEGSIFTYSLKFENLYECLAFTNFYNQSVYEILNREKWSKVGEEDAKYLLNPMLDVDMDGGSKHDEYSDDDTENDSDYDSSNSDTEDEDERSTAFTESKKNSSSNGSKGRNQMLAVGYKTDRSFVSRGSTIGVFRHQDGDDELGLVSELSVTNPNNKKSGFNPSKMMLHQEDRSLLLMNPEESNSVFRMDLERGVVVDEWKINDSSNAAITSMVPDSKYSQMSGKETFIGMNSNSIFRVDPRLAGNKRVDSEMKSYVVKNEFSCGATTGAGELAVASAKGEIRLFNKLDKRAKTLLPMFGDPIIGIDVTESGKYILATCKTYLLLICTVDTENVDSTGFTKPMSSTDRPVPKRLQLKPEHVAYMGSQPSFTPARFSTGQSEERSIITSTGPFVITWNLRRVKQGNLHDYQIKKYQDTVVADNFRFGQDRSIVVTLPEHVTLISKKSLAAPSPKSLRHGKNIVNEFF